MKAMLLCLDREQRLIYILGELFEFTDAIGAEIMEMTRENFRIKLHRARQHLYNFMDHKCGLVNQKNPCRCARKTAGFIKMGFVDPVKLHFQRDAIASINAAAGEKVEAYTGEVLHGYRELFRSHPFLKADDQLSGIRKLLDSDTFRKTFNLDH
ncbi:MAG: hypothetical protein HC859_03825 [Bacteroidia bacterium]|nr:hypothetical protein [Bacteroidia bacterium]